MCHRYRWVLLITVSLAACGGSSASTVVSTEATSGNGVTTGQVAVSGSSGDTYGSTEVQATVGGSSGVAMVTTGAMADTGSVGGLSCDDIPNAIVTDIDQTLTVSDQQWVEQLLGLNNGPEMREGAQELIQGYADRGYYVLYLTARPETSTVTGTNESARIATERWLMEHDFPRGVRTDLILSPTLVLGENTRTYKAQALMDKQAEGWVFDAAYGNADTDITAYEDAGIAKDTTFIIGDQAGMMGTQAIEGEDFVMHVAEYLPGVEAVCDPSL